MALKKKYPRVLLCCPTHRSKDYCFDDWAENVKNFSYPNFAVTLVDNSPDKDYVNKIREKGFNAIHIKTKAKSTIAMMAESHEICRQQALNNGYDYMFHLESDVFPPTSIISDLLSIRKPIASGWYHKDFGKNSKPLIQLFEGVTNDNFNNTFTVNSDAILFLDGQIKPVFHAGIGCIMIHKSVLPKFKFRYLEGRDIYPDIFFAQDMAYIGEKIWVDTSLLVKHQNISHGIFKLAFEA